MQTAGKPVAYLSFLCARFSIASCSIDNHQNGPISIPAPSPEVYFRRVQKGVWMLESKTEQLKMN